MGMRNSVLVRLNVKYQVVMVVEIQEGKIFQIPDTEWVYHCLQKVNRILGNDIN
jgi:hypothetical protein